MKNSLWLFLVFIFSAGLSAQECDNRRYYDELFDFNVTTAIKFGEAPQPLVLKPDNIQELFMDVYQPEGDTLSARPLIIWAFGGAFVFGSKESPDIVTLSSAFAKRGYVNAAIDYRLSTDLLVNSDISNVYEAILKATHDMLASIRFFYKDAATINEFKIDTTRIYIGGVSAGAITALQIAHFDELNEVPIEIDSLFQMTGGFTGNSGNEGYSQDIAGVISLCGAIKDTTWINPAVNIPIASMHGTDDHVVPYGSDTITILGIDLDVDGSSSIHYKLDQYSIENEFYTFQGADHTPFVRNQAYMDTTIWFVRDFLYDLVCEDITTANETAEIKNGSFSIYPNPNSGNFQIRLNTPENLGIFVFDYLGRKVFSNPEIHQGLNSLELDLPRGTYTVHVYSRTSRQFFNKKIMVH